MNKKVFRQELPLLVMLLPAVILVFIYNYIPFFGIVIAFQSYMPAIGMLKSDWVGLQNFTDLFNQPDFFQVLWNTIFIAFMKIVTGLIVPVIVALLLNEVGNKKVKRTYQTLVYLPFFLSWVILGGVFIDILSPNGGLVNQFLGVFGIRPIFFLGSDNWFPFTLIVTNAWQTFGYGTVIYLAALTNIDPTLYEAAIMDGAGRWKQTLYVTLPGMLPIIILMVVLSLGNILNAGFDQVFNLYSPIVYHSGDIIDTMLYRIGLVNAQYSLSTAAGLFKSVISCVFVVTSYKLADKFAGYRIF